MGYIYIEDGKNTRLIFKSNFNKEDKLIDFLKDNRKATKIRFEFV